MSAMAFQITSLAIVYSTVHSLVDQRKHQSSASLAFVWGIHRWQVNSRHKWPVTWKMFPFDDVIMIRNKLPYELSFCACISLGRCTTSRAVFTQSYRQIRSLRVILLVLSVNNTSKLIWCKENPDSISHVPILVWLRILLSCTSHGSRNDIP